jgi:hypothetical protein
VNEGGKLNFREQLKVVWEGIKKGYKYDGCTAVPDFDFGADCCGEHDTYYQDLTITRAEADKKLRECIQKKGYILLPWVYWLGVRLFAGGVWEQRQRKKAGYVAPNMDSPA